MNTYRKIIFGIVTTLVVAILFSCEGNLNQVRAMDIPDDAPQAIGKNLYLKYTDSGRVIARLKSSKMLDFTNKKFPFREFPEGVELEFFDRENEMSRVTANYAILYDATELIDLQGDVVLITSDSTRLEADQLYWDQDRDWVFTDTPNVIKFPNGAVNRAEGFDSDLNFSNFRSRTNVGIQIIKEKKE